MVRKGRPDGAGPRIHNGVIREHQAGRPWEFKQRGLATPLCCRAPDRLGRESVLVLDTLLALTNILRISLSA